MLPPFGTHKTDYNPSNKSILFDSFKKSPCSSRKVPIINKQSSLCLLEGNIARIISVSLTRRGGPKFVASSKIFFPGPLPGCPYSITCTENMLYILDKMFPPACWVWTKWIISSVLLKQSSTVLVYSLSEGVQKVFLLCLQY